MKQSLILVLAVCALFLVFPVAFPPATRAGDTQSENIIVLHTPDGKWHIKAMTNDEILQVHPGARIDAPRKLDPNGPVRSLYLVRFVMNAQIREGVDCRLLGWRQVYDLLCNGEPVVNYWETSFQEP